jgi:hypothetical protein
LRRARPNGSPKGPLLPEAMKRPLYKQKNSERFRGDDLYLTHPALVRWISALTSTTARHEKAGFAKLVDASATMGANLALVK